MKKLILLTIFLLALTISGVAQVKSVYTSTKTANCKQVKQGKDAGDSYVGICPGTGGYTVELLEGERGIAGPGPAESGMVDDEIDLRPIFGGATHVIDFRVGREVWKIALGRGRIEALVHADDVGPRLEDLLVEGIHQLLVVHPPGVTHGDWVNQ